MKYIDVSEHQGVIDWEQVKPHIDGAILRAGYGRGTVDKCFVRNATECNRLGIPIGAYWFSYAYSPAMAGNEAKAFLSAISPYNLELPLAWDFEYDSVSYAAGHTTVTRELVQQMATAFCEAIEEAKYYCMLYANADFINKYFGELAGTRFDLWLASWPKKVDVKNPPRKCGIWQWGGSSVPGINGNVDTNESYHDYKALIASVGLNNPPPPRPWYAEAQDWATSVGITDGERPDEPATRAEVWTMLHRYSSKYCGPRYSGLIDE